MEFIRIIYMKNSSQKTFILVFSSIVIICVIIAVFSVISYRNIMKPADTGAEADYHSPSGGIEPASAVQETAETPAATPYVTPEPTPETICENPCPEYFNSFSFEEAKEKIPAADMWLRIENTAIDYPVVYGPDNDFYLKHSIDGADDQHGTLFTDVGCLPEFSSKITIVYGHNMADGTMFENLMRYKDQSYVDRYPYVCLYSEGRCYVAEIFAGVYFNGETDTLVSDFADNNEYMKYVGFLIDNSIIARNIDIPANSRLLAMCTCTYEFTDGRYVLFAKLNRVK